jgi:site-specific DNA-methyltransferase (adenine-specific)
MEIHNGDCLEVMKTLPDKSVDLFVCDLPYGCLTGGGGQEKKRRQLVRYVDGNATTNTAVYNGGVIAGCAWDIKLDLEAFWVQVKRLCKDDHTPVLMFCNTKFGFDLYNSNPDWFRYDLVWNKSRGVSFLSANKMPLKCHEMIYVFSKKGANYYRKDIEGDFPAYVGSHSAAKVYNLAKPNLEGYKKVDNGKRCVKSVVSINNETNKGGKHPTAKPVELYKWLVERYSKENDCVLDPTFGSGNSGRACAELRRSYIGIEKDKGFYDKYKPCE